MMVMTLVERSLNEKMDLALILIFERIERLFYLPSTDQTVQECGKSSVFSKKPRPPVFGVQSETLRSVFGATSGQNMTWTLLHS